MTSLSGLYIDETFPRLVQTDATRTQFADGLGNSITFGQTPTGSLLLTASAVGNTITFTKGDGSQFPVTVTGGSGTTFPYTGSAIISGSLIVTGSTTSTLGFTGSLFGTSSWAYSSSVAISSSYATTASYALNGLSGGTNTYIPLWSGSNTLTSSYLNQSNNILKSTYNGTDKGLKLDFGNNDYLFGVTGSISTYDDKFLKFNSTGSHLNDGGIGLKTRSNSNVLEIGDIGFDYGQMLMYFNRDTSVIKTTFDSADVGLKLDFGGSYTLGDPNGVSGDYGYIEVTPVGFTAWTAESSLYSTTIQIGRNDLASQIGIYGNDVSVTGSAFTWNNRTVASIDNGRATHIPFFSTDNILSTSSIYQSGSNSIIINSDVNTTGNPEALYVQQTHPTSFNVISGKGNLNNYLQLNIHNTNAGTSVSSDVVATANNGDENGNYIDMGINGSNFSGPIGNPNDAYLYSTGSDLHIGNATPNKPVQFFAGGINTDTNRKFQLNANNQHNMTGSLDISGSLAIRNLVTASVSNVLTYNPSTGQVYYTASSAIGGGGSGTPVAILDEGTQITPSVTSINFTGAGVAATNVGNAVTVTINGTSIDTSTFATTGSNIFRGNQTVTGSLFTTGSNTLIGTTTLTGSLNITGSTTQVGNNTLAGNTLLSGSITISGSTTVPASPTIKVYGDMETNGVIKFLAVDKNIDTTISGSYIYVSGSTNDLYFSQNGAGFNNNVRLRWLEGGALYTGLLRGGVISSTPGTTTFNITSGSGLLVTMNASTASEPYPTVQYVSWPNFTAQPITYSGSAKITYVGISSAGTIIQQTTPWGTSDINQWDNSISLGVVLHLSGSVSTGVFNSPQISYGGQQKTDDFFRAFGPLKISGHTLQASGSTMSIIKSAGSSYREGANYIINANHPSTVTENSINVSKIYRYYLSGSTPVIDTGVASAGYTVIDPTKYVDTATGLLATVNGGQYSLQRVFWVPNSPTNAFIVYYGNAKYNSLVDAVNAKETEPFSEAPNTALNAIFVGYIAVNGGASSLTNASDASIIQAGLFRNVGGVGSGGTNFVSTTLAGLADVSLSGNTPGDLLVYGTGTTWNNKKQLTGSYGLTGSLTVTQNVSASSFTGSLFGTATTASYITSSFFTGTNAALSASYATTASYALTSPGGGGYTVVSVSSTPYTATQTSGDIVLLVDATTAGATTINLPTAVGNTAKFTIKKIDTGTNTVTIDGNSSETIDGSLTAVLKVPYVSVTLISNSSNWFVI